LDQFRDWAKSDRVLKADWDATWRNSVRRWKERKARFRSPGRPGPYRNPPSGAQRAQQQFTDPDQPETSAQAAWESWGASPGGQR
jgi:hypothetical protein